MIAPPISDGVDLELQFDFASEALLERLLDLLATVRRQTGVAEMIVDLHLVLGLCLERVELRRRSPAAP